MPTFKEYVESLSAATAPATGDKLPVLQAGEVKAADNGNISGTYAADVTDTRTDK